MQAKEAVEVEHRFFWDVDAGTHGVVLRFAVRDDNIEPVGGTALEDYDQALRTRAALICAERSASEETRDGGGADARQCAVAEEYAASDGHGILAFSF